MIAHFSSNDASLSQNPPPRAETSATAARLRERYDAVERAVRQAERNAGREANSVRIVAVSKTQPAEVVRAALEAGITRFGENYAQELRDKASALAELGGEWRFIGHLQTNKARMIAPFVSCVESVDSPRLAAELSRAARAVGRTIDVLAQVNTSGEESKYGCAPDDATRLVEAILGEEHIRLRGFMTIAAYSDNPEYVRPMFRLLKSLQTEAINRFPEAAAKGAFLELSMGMSADFPVAIQEGATLVRIGSSIFGERAKKSA
jgi:pyridoxal phosphate enzyme (YggS family)